MKRKRLTDEQRSKALKPQESVVTVAEIAVLLARWSRPSLAGNPGTGAWRAPRSGGFRYWQRRAADSGSCWPIPCRSMPGSRWPGQNSGQIGPVQGKGGPLADAGLAERTKSLAGGRKQPNGTRMPRPAGSPVAT